MAGRHRRPRHSHHGRRGKRLTAAAEVAWLSEVTGQSAADLLAVPATVYEEIKGRVLDRLEAELAAEREAESLNARASLMSDLKRQMGR